MDNKTSQQISKECPDKHPWDKLTKQELFLISKYHEARADQLEKIVMIALCGQPDATYTLQVEENNEN